MFLDDFASLARHDRTRRSLFRRRCKCDLTDFFPASLPKLRGGQKGSLPNGMLVLKGGDLAEELGEARLRCDIHRISEMFEEEFFATKCVIYARK